jgi:AraC-like DNA-binding protein
MPFRGLSRGPEISTALLAQLARYLDHLKIETAPILRSCGVDPSILETPDARIEMEKYLAVQEKAAELSGDALFGLHMGEFAEPGSFSIVGFIMMNCRTLGEAFLRSGKYYKVVGTMIRGSGAIERGLAKAVFSLASGAPELSRHCFESTLASSVRLMRTLAGDAASPKEVRFTHAAPASDAEHRRIFRCPVFFGRKENALLLDLKILSLPVMAANPALLPHFEEYAQALLARFEGGQRYSQAVADAIARGIGKAAPTVGAIAKDLSMSARTLQTRLEEEGRDFSGILRDVRSELAKKYLRARYSVDDVTFLLGFSDPVAFRKAFKKWSGLTPREYREMDGMAS